MRKVCLAGLAVIAFAAASARGEEWSHQYPLKGRPDLHVKTDDGNVRIEASTGAEIAARVTTEGWRIAPDEVTITQSQTGDRVDIEVRLPKGHFRIGSGHRSISVALRMPKQGDLEVQTGDGSIEVPAVSGRISLTTGDGSISADGPDGEIHLQTGDGAIRATGLSGRLAASSGDGHMNLRGRFTGLDLRSGDGGIEAAVEPGSKVEAPWSLRSGDGGITLRLPEGLGAELDARTGEGGIVVEKPVTVTGTVRENSVRGTLGPGGPPLRIQTGDGSIRLLGL